MDVTSVAAYGTELQNARVSLEADVAVAKKAQDIEKVAGEDIVQLIKSSAELGKPVSPDGRGQLIDVYA